MDLKCRYCEGQFKKATLANHFQECEVWKARSRLLKAAKKYLSRNASNEDMLIAELHAVLSLYEPAEEKKQKQEPEVAGTFALPDTKKPTEVPKKTPEIEKKVPESPGISSPPGLHDEEAPNVKEKAPAKPTSEDISASSISERGKVDMAGQFEATTPKSKRDSKKNKKKQKEEDQTIEVPPPIISNSEQSADTPKQLSNKKEINKPPIDPPTGIPKGLPVIKGNKMTNELYSGQSDLKKDDSPSQISKPLDKELPVIDNKKFEEEKKEILPPKKQKHKKKIDSAPMEETKHSTDYSNMFECFLCNSCHPFEEILIPDCMHFICKGHAEHTIRESKNLFQVRCPHPECGYNYARQEIILAMGEERLERLEEERLGITIGSKARTMATCPRCNKTGIVEPGYVDEYFRDENGKFLTSAARINMENYRFSCPCGLVFCANCLAVPYHVGKTCSEVQMQDLCNYCGRENPCDASECSAKREKACKEVMSCGHQCAGIAGETKHVGCLKIGCSSGKFNEHDACPVCMNSLKTAPCTVLNCGDIFHTHCVVDVLSHKWNGPNITFKYANCPVCRVWIESDVGEIAVKMEETKEFYREIEEVALKRLSIERMDKAKILKDPKSEFFERPQHFAMNMFSFYQCSKCKGAYFGGMRKPHQDIERKMFREDENICAVCASGEDKTCQVHGRTFVDFKCNFCCSIACWLREGIHLCDECHRKMQNGEITSDIPPEALTACKGKKRCRLRIEHPENGKEFLLGCAQCRFEETAKE